MQEFDWKNNVDNKEEKLKLAERMAKRVKNGDIIGFGSGTTSYLTVIEIAKKIKNENLKIKAIPTSTIIEDNVIKGMKFPIIENLCKELKIETISLNEAKPMWCFDGADEIDSHNWLIKGMGAALYKEKMNMKNSEENYILVDSSKFVERLGEKHPVPIECEIEKIEQVKEEVKKLGATKLEIRKSNTGEGYLITDNGNYILHAWFDKIEASLEQKLVEIDGAVESGLFIGYNIIVVS